MHQHHSREDQRADSRADTRADTAVSTPDHPPGWATPVPVSGLVALDPRLPGMAVHRVAHHRPGHSFGMIRRFGVSIGLDAEAPQPGAAVKTMAFNGRPGATHIGGDPHGSTRHIVSWDLEMDYRRSLFVGRKLGDIARELNCQPTRSDVQEAIKQSIRNDRGNRLTYQGTAHGNAGLGQLAGQGAKILQRDPQPGTEEWTVGHLMSVLGALDLPPGAERRLVEHQVDRAGSMYATSRGLDQQSAHLIARNGFAALWDDQRRGFRSGDEIASRYRGLVMASQSAIPLSAASMLSSWHLSAPPQAQQYPALPPTHGPQHLGQPAFGHPHPQPLVPYTAPNQLLPPIRQVFQDVDFDRKY